MTFTPLVSVMQGYGYCLTRELFDPLDSPLQSEGNQQIHASVIIGYRDSMSLYQIFVDSSPGCSQSNTHTAREGASQRDMTAAQKDE